MKHCFFILVLLALTEFLPSPGANDRPNKSTFQQNDLILAFNSDVEASADYDDLFSKSKLLVGYRVTFTSPVVTSRMTCLSHVIRRTAAEKVALYLRVGNFRI